jgi:2-methylcitrate dehydratase PrpD
VVNPRHYGLGWHSTATIGVIGAAAACGRLLGLDAARMGHAMSMAVSMAAGSRMQLGTPAKSLHAGLAAKGGVLAAALAGQGLEGTTEALGGRWRMADHYTGSPADPAAFRPPMEAERLGLESPGLTFKAYPTCASTHLAIDAILALRDAHRFEAAEIAAIATNMPAVNERNLTYVDPVNGMQARFSMHYCAALAATDGAVTVRAFEGDAIFRPEVRALMARVTMDAIPGSEMAEDATPDFPTSVVIRLHDGRVLEEARTVRRGSPGLPLTEAEQRRKFMDCAGMTLSATQAQAVLDRIEGLADGVDIAVLMAGLRGEATG